MKLEKKLDLLIRTLTLAVAILVCAKIWYAAEVPPANPVKFEKPVKLMPESGRRSAKIPKYTVSLEHRKIAHAFFRKSCRRLDSADFLGAQGFIDQAIAEDPGNQKYHKMARLVRTEIANRESMNKIIRQINAARYDHAWSSFESACSDNYLFFSRYAQEYANLLISKNQPASATLILLALSEQS